MTAISGKALFLDRDGVINRRLPGNYVKDWSEFVFLDGVLEAIPLFNKIFDKVFVVTNQQGIGKGLMTAADLLAVHQRMLEKIEENGGLINRIYYCPSLKHATPNCRKPDPAMGFQAAADYPEINLNHSWMAGDSVSDIEFGWNCGMQTALIATNPEEKKNLSQHPGLIHGKKVLIFSALIDLASYLSE